MNLKNNFNDRQGSYRKQMGSELIISSVLSDR